MIPKVEACLQSLEAGVLQTHIIDGRLRHSLLLEIFTHTGIGTEIGDEHRPVRSPAPGRRPTGDARFRVTNSTSTV
jgi:acetylglutamate kinase